MEGTKEIKEERQRIKEQLTTAKSIIKYFDGNPSLSYSEWLEADRILDEWFANPAVLEAEK